MTAIYGEGLTMQAAVGYLRVSTREQGRSGLGLAAQRFEIEQFGAREGFSVLVHRVTPMAALAIKKWTLRRSSLNPTSD